VKTRSVSLCFILLIILSICILPVATEAKMLVHFTDCGVGDWAIDVEAGDLDGDGDLDLVVPNADSNDISVLLGNGDGSFLYEVRFDTLMPLNCELSDLDGNGTLDLVLLQDFAMMITVFFGAGDGSFAADETYVDEPVEHYFTLGDLDNNDRPDLIVSSWETDVLSVLLNNGDGTFQAPVNFDAGSGPWITGVDDFNGDGNLDLIVANDDLHPVILLGNGDGTLQTAISLEHGPDSPLIGMDDLDGDGITDLVMPEYTDDTVSVLLGNGDGTFQPAGVYAMGQNSRLLIGDLDGDNHPDLVATDGVDDSISVYLGIGDGTFHDAVFCLPLASPYGSTLADLDGNGHLDLAVIRGGQQLIAILLNTTLGESILAGPGPAEGNSPLVRLFPPEQGAAPAVEFQAYGAAHYGVNVASGELDGHGGNEIITGAGPGAIYGPHVRGFASSGTPLPGLSFLAYGTSKYGVNVAAGDLDGDGLDEIITGAGPGAVFGPHVRGWIYRGAAGVTPFPGVSYFAYGTPKWGVNVATGDLDGDGYDEIITGAGPGAVYGPHVRGWNVDGGKAVAIPGVSFLAYGTPKFGVNVGCGDVDGDGIDEIVTGAGPGSGFAPHVRGWNHDGNGVTPLPGFSFFAWQTEPLSFGVNVWAGTDLDRDGRADVVAGRGPDPTADTEVKVFAYDGEEVTELLSLEAFTGLTHGATVAAGRF